MKSSIASGNWSTAATWGTIRNTPTLHSSANLILSASNRFTATFTAPNTTNAVTGVWLYLALAGTATINVTLQESTVDTAATKSVAFTTGTSITSAGWKYFEFATPYTYTTTAAGAYRFRITNSSITTASQVRADSGATLPAFLAVDDATGVPGAESTWIAHDVVMDGTQTVGAGTDTAALATGSQASIGYGLQVAYDGSLVWDTVASAQLTCLGHFGVSADGVVNMGTVATPYPAGQTAKLILNQNGTSGNYGIHVSPTATFIGQGQPHTTGIFYSSGLGTAASPLIVSAATDWAVGDEIAIAGGVYNQTEYRYIITVNSPTSFVVSSTAGGAETALVNAHATTQPVLNLTYNLVFETTDAARGAYWLSGADTVGKVDVDNARFNTFGANSGSTTKQGIGFCSNQGVGLLTTYGEFNNVVSYGSLYDGFLLINSQSTQTFSGLIAIKNAVNNNNTGAFAMLANSSNKTLNDCYAIDYQTSGIFMTTATNSVFTRFNIWCCNGANSTSYGGIQTSGSVAATWNDCVIQACRTNGITFNSATKFTFNNLHCGDYFTNTIDVSCIAGGYNADCHFEGATFGSATFVSNYVNQGAGSKLSFQNLNGVATDNRTYESTGTTRSVGAGLADTNVRTADSLAWRIAPENNTIGMVKDLKVLAKANSAVSVFGFLQKNAAFGTSTCTVELLLPGETVSADSYTMPNDTAWNVFALSASYEGDVDLYATLRITAITATASAYVYLDDLYNGTNKITAIDVFDRGEPSPIQFEQLGDSAAVWAVLTSTLTTAGTTGKKLVDDLTTNKFIALK